MLSMFGINEVNQIYHEILCQLVLKNDLVFCIVDI